MNYRLYSKLFFILLIVITKLIVPPTNDAITPTYNKTLTIFGRNSKLYSVIIDFEKINPHLDYSTLYAKYYCQ
jgi:hypothetical protein